MSVLAQLRVLYNIDNIYYDQLCYFSSVFIRFVISALAFIWANNYATQPMLTYFIIKVNTTFQNKLSPVTS